MNEDSRIEGELRRVLDLRTFIDLTPDDLRHLSAWLRPKLPANKRGTAARMARLLVLEAACGESAEVAKNGAVLRPLKAAKHLLALGVYQPEDLHATVEDTRHSLIYFKSEDKRVMVADHPADNLGLRKRIAASAAGYAGDSRRTLTPARLDDIASALWAQVKRLAGRPDLTSILEERKDRIISALARYEQYKQTSAKNAGTQVSSNEDAARPRRRWTRFALPIVVGVGLLVIGIPVAVMLLSPPPATSVDIYRPLSATIETTSEYKLEPETLRCQFDSEVSERYDASSCFGVSVGYDPCFATGRDGVFDCPSATAAGVQSRYFEAEVVFSNYDLVGAPSFSEILKDEDPWAIEIAVGLGHHWACLRQDLLAGWWDIRGSRWVCSKDALVPGYRLVGDPDTSGPPYNRDEEDTSPPFLIRSVDVPEDALIAGELDRDGEVWTVLVADASGSLGVRTVTKAWY